MSFDLPGGSPQLAQAVDRLARQMPRFPIRLWQVATADLPAAGDYAGRMLWDSTDLTVKWSDGTSWVKPALSGHTHTIANVTGLQAALDAKEPTITAGTTAQYWRGDKSWQTLDKAAVGLGNVDNTSDANKPVSTAQATAIAAKQDADADLTAVASSNLAAAWTAFTPTITAGTGTFTSVSGSGRYLKIGKMVMFHMVITITTNGTAATNIHATLPFTSVNAGGFQVFPFREVALVGITGTGSIAANSTNMLLYKYDNSYPGGSGYEINCSGSYECA